VAGYPQDAGEATAPRRRPRGSRREDPYVTNLTVVVDDHVLRRARQRAVEEGVSISAVLRDALRRYAREGSGFEGFIAMSARLDADA
jgi:hypothetical protein